MYFSAEFLEELSERANIVDIVSDYTQLKLKGSNYFGLCPFHSEKTPSFSVSADKEFFHCFGCGVGGDVITFVMRAENLDFTDAIRFLSEKLGLSLPEVNDYGGAERRARILELNTFAARYFHDCLMSAEGQQARNYLKNRGITDRTIRRFGIGYAPDYWDGLIKAAKGFEKSELLEARLVVSNKSTGGIYDMFRGRVIFPIIDIRGNVIAFGGRLLGDGGPKYLNSPDTPVYNKSRHLFALNMAKKSKSRRYILAEGYMDVVSLHQAGFDTAVASLGTSLTDQQARLLAKYADEVVIAYDSDGAGRSAADRAIELLEKTNVKVKLVDYPGAKDPDEYIKKFGAEAFRLRLDRSENQIEYKLDLVKSKYDLSNDEQRIEFLKESAQVLSRIDNPVEMAVYVARVAETGKVDQSVLEREIKLLTKARLKRERGKQRQRTLRPTLSVQPKAKELRYKNVRSAVAEERLLSLLLCDLSLIETASKLLTPEQFSSDTLGKTYGILISHLKSNKPFSTALLSQSLNVDEMEHISSILVKSVPEGDKMQALRDYIEVILEEYEKSLLSEKELLLREWQRMKGKKGLEDRP
ncbi:MAG: DNA primase [Eubacteriales bacterium]